MTLAFKFIFLAFALNFIGSINAVDESVAPRCKQYLILELVIFQSENFLPVNTRGYPHEQLVHKYSMESLLLLTTELTFLLQALHSYKEN